MAMASKDFSNQFAVDLSMANSQAAPTLAYLSSQPGAGRYNVNLAFQKDVKGAQNAQQNGTLDNWQPTNLQGCANKVCSDISKDTGGQVQVQKTGEGDTGGKKKSWFEKLFEILMLLVALYSIYSMIIGAVGFFQKSGKAKAEADQVITKQALPPKEQVVIKQALPPGVTKQVPMVQNEVIKTTPLVRPGLAAVPTKVYLNPDVSAALNNLPIGPVSVLNQNGYTVSGGGYTYNAGVVKTASGK